MSRKSKKEEVLTVVLDDALCLVREVDVGGVDQVLVKPVPHKLVPDVGLAPCRTA